MTSRRTIGSGVVVGLLGLLWIAGSATAHPPTGTPPEPGDARVAGVTAPLLQYQGRLTDPGTGEPVADGSHTMTFRLYESELGSTELWIETKDVSVQDGVFSTILGDKTSLDHAVFDGRELWLGVKVGADSEAMPRQRVLPVAYALSLVPGAQISNTISSVAFTLGGDAIVGHGGQGEWDAGVVGYGNSEAHGMGVVGWGQVSSGESYGVFGSSSSPYGAGVYGEGYSGSHGVYGETFYEGGFYETAGVLGYSVYTDSAGVMGNSKLGNGVFGYISTVTSTSSAVAGYHAGAGNGVSGASAESHGVAGETHNDTGGYVYAGVHGSSTHTETFGVLGESEYGRGVEGRTWRLDNTNPAVHGYSTGGGPGVAGYSQNSRGVEGSSDSNHGVYGETSYDMGFYEANGVMGYSVYTYSAGVYGKSVYGNGVIGIASGDEKSGIVGFNSGSGSGVSASSELGHGLEGSTNSDTGDFAYAGVYGRSTHTETFGVRGESDYGIAVEGRITELSNTNPAVIGYNTGGGDGVLGYSENDVGVRGIGATYAGLFSSDSGMALRAEGDAEVDGHLAVSGDLAASGQVTGGDGTSLPIAYGFVDADGSLVSGSSNLSSSWDSQQAWYAISIFGYSYVYNEYCTVVTPAFGCSPAPCSAQTSSSGGELLIQVIDASGSPVQARFQFVTYQP